LEVVDYIVHGARAALVGDTNEAKRVGRRLRVMRDSGTSSRFERAFAPWFSLIEAGLAKRRNEWRSVIDLLEPWGDGVREPGHGFGDGDTFLIWWLLSEAYTNIGEFDSAIVHLQSIVGPPHYRAYDWMVYGLPFSASYFKLGQLYDQVGNREEAVDHFTTFLGTFTDPDPEYVWMVEEARAGIERLGRGR
jgi:hypothetical protein